ncbi:segregation and condensation protein A [Streptomyces halstedii]|uniref:segregation and condensation protein A n=1 Tax=Streptomyces halstedii TaxID=1944 RepID=UPI0037B65629
MPTAHDPPRPLRRALGRGPQPKAAPAAAGQPPAPGGPAADVATTGGVGLDTDAAGLNGAGVGLDAAEGPAAVDETGGSVAAETGAPEAGAPEAGAPETGAAGTGAAGDAAVVTAPPGEETPAVPGAAEGPGEAASGDERRFTVRLVNFEGPFDLLLQLISKHKLDVTEVALSKVTDEFMAHIRAMGPDWDLDQTTEFLVVAATLLDLKAARLLPTAEVEDEADLALLEARDLLFARLLQYRAYKRVAEIFQDRLDSEARRHPRTVGLEPHHAELLPEVVISVGPDGFARLAVKAMRPRPEPQVYVDHIHAPLVSVREQAEVVVARLRAEGETSFRALTEDAPDTLTVVARFLALLELYREKAVALDQEEALGELLVRWAGAEGTEPLVTDEFDQEVREAREDVEE